MKKHPKTLSGGIIEAFKKVIPVTKKDFTLIVRAAAYLKPYRWSFTTALLCLLASIGFALAEPWIGAKIVTSIFSGDWTRLLRMVMIMGTVSLCNLLTEWLQTSLYARLTERIVFDIKNDMFKKIVHLPTKAFDNLQIGEFISRLNGDAGTIANILVSRFVSLIVDIMRAIIIGIIIFRLSTRLSFAVTVCLSVSYFIFIISGRLLRKQNEILAKLQDTYFSSIQETVSGIREVKSMGIQEQRLNGFFTLGSKLMKKGIVIGILSAGASCASRISNIAAHLTAITYGFYLVTRKRLQVEPFIAYLNYMHQFFYALMNVTRMNSAIQQALVSLKRIFELMDNFSYAPIAFGTIDKPSVSGSITFEDVCFSYDDNRNVLKGISFSVNSGAVTAIVGRSGGGKTTIFNLLLRLYQPEQGRILLDNIDIGEITEKSLRQTIAVVRQDPYLFRMSIRDNLLLAAPNASESDLIQSCKVACIHEDIINSTDGYDTLIGEDGANLSIGQRQRLAIARAVLRNAPIILFDEATSALDNNSQSHVKKAIRNLSDNRTILIIAHRLSTILDADTIIVLNDGRIGGIGTRSELYKNNSVFHELYETEFTACETLRACP